MDKYQKYLMEENEFTFIGGSEEDRNVWNSETFVFNQDSDIMLKGYCLNIDNKTIQSVYAITGSNESLLCSEDFDTLQSKLVIPIDFDDKIDKIRIVFKNNLADDLIVPFVYNDADKNAYYARVEQERRLKLLNTANIKISTGADLVNIYFQPCSDIYSKTIIELYTATGKFEQRRIPNVIPYGVKLAPPKLLGGTINVMIGQFTVEQGMFFKSITGLAHGVYAIKLLQFDKNNNELLKSDELFFVIR